MSLALDRKGRLKLSERDIEQQLVDALMAHGWRVLRTNKFCSGNAIVVQGAVEPGIPDLMAWKYLYLGEASRLLRDTIWRPARIVLLEVKRPGEDLNGNQYEWWAVHPEDEKRIARSLEDIEDLLYD
jgi:hypothetical protein